jgi:hypothetical protein
MTRTAVAAITAIRTRLQGAGYTVQLGRVIDPAQDLLPAVTVHYSGDGDQTIMERPERVAELDLVIEYWDRTRTGDPLLELIPVGDAIRALFTAHDSDRLDRLGGVADECRHIKTIIQTHMDHTDVGVVHTVVRVKY